MAAASAPVHLVGGGWDPTAAEAVFGPFLDDAGRAPVIACVIVHEGDGAAQFARWAKVLSDVRLCAPVPVLVPEGDVLSLDDLGSADGLLVCGGLTPAYGTALLPVAPELRTWLAARPYCGFSAGAAVAAVRAVLGGWLLDGIAVCPEDASEDEDELLVVDGLGLVDATIDVHCTQWGTLPRLLATGGRGLALDENTAVRIEGGRATVAGTGHAFHVAPDGGSRRVTAYQAGQVVALTDL